MKRLRYLIVGYGNIGHKRQNALGKKCVGTFDINPKQNPTYSKLKDIPVDNFDAAVITTPQDPKLELVKHFLKLKKHVLVEKPLIITSKEGKELEKLAKENKVIWHTSYNHRFEPNIEKLNKIIKAGTLGPLYHARFVYSFGNIKERIGTWRETKYGVLEEIAPHLIDFTLNIFKYKGKDFKPLIKRKVESKIFDHWVFSTTDDKIVFETSSVTWKYIFSLDIYGQKGSVHISQLNKWGGSTLIIRKRVLPSGAPLEKIIHTQGSDITWKKDFKFFERMAKAKITSLNGDLELSEALKRVCLG